MNLHCIIIDDEPNAIKLLKVLIEQYTKWQCIGECYNAIEAYAFLKLNKVDFIFLDINMPQLTGMELAALLPSETRIVFTTAYSEFAAESFNFQTIDYLLKPITLKRFMSGVNKIESFFNSLGGEKTPPKAASEHFFFKSGKVLKKIQLTDIFYFEGEQEYVRIVTQKDQLLIYKRLKEIQEQLDLPFIRVHNSYIVNSKQIDKIQDNQIYISEKKIPISEKFREDFMQMITKRIF